MRAIIVVGWTNSNKGQQPKMLYCGLDGVEATQISDKARESGKFDRIGRLTNPSFTPVAHLPFPKHDGKKPVEVAKPETKPEDSQSQTTKE